MTMAVTQILSYLTLILYKSSKNVVKKNNNDIPPLSRTAIEYNLNAF